jgi:hypothetical protein
VLRPDKFVFGISRGDVGALTRQLVTQLGLAGPGPAGPERTRRAPLAGLA